MTQTDGEKELVLGNKQLISLFFVVVALCGVFFAMGYMIGHNTSKPAVASLDGGSSASTATVSPVPQSQESQPSPDPQTPQPEANATDPNASGPPRETPQPETQPAQPEPAAATAHTVPVQTQAAKETPAVPVPGATYLQVTALRRSDADNLVKTLREQNFPVLLADSSKPDLFRVLVGPYHQTADVADAKARLKSLGFANAFVQK